MKTIEDARKFWAKVARENGWYAEPFYVQVWTDTAGNIIDSVSTVGMDRDHVVVDTDGDYCEECGLCLEDSQGEASCRGCGRYIES
jgi:hypothetical protein